MNIDVHAHVIPPEILRDANFENAWRPHVFRDAYNRQKIDFGGITFDSVIREFVDIDRILEAQKLASVDVLVVSPWSFLFGYDLPTQESYRHCRVLNDSISRMVNDHPGQLAGLGMVPLQDARLAASEAEYIVRDLRLHGIEIGTNVKGTYIGDEKILAFWEAVAGLDTFVFVHPVPGIGGVLMQQFELRNLFGNPSETGLAAASLIFNGIIERFPSIKICLAHGGGTLPYIIGRLDRGFQVRPAVKQAKITRPPSTYLRQFYFDTITHSSDALHYLIQVVGADHIVLGSDYPFDMGYERPCDVLNVLGLSDEQLNAILGATAMRLLMLKM